MTTAANQRGAPLVFSLAAITALFPLSLDMYMPAMPTIAHEFGEAAGAVQLTLSIALIGNALGMIVIGPISDRLGRRGPALAGLAVYLIATIGCAVAASVEWLIAARLLQAIAVVGGLITARSILSDLFEPREMARYVSMQTLVTGVAPLLAPLFGGIILMHFGWRAIFWVLAACGVLSIIAAYFSLPETRDAQARAVSRKETPIASYVALLKQSRLMRLTLCGGFAQAIFFTYLVNASNLIIVQFDVSAAQFGVYFGVNAIGFLASNQINRMLLRRFEPAQILYWSLRCTLALLLVLLALTLMGAGKWPILIALFIAVASFPYNNANAMALAQGEDRARGGAVASFYGAMTALIGAIASTASSLLYNGTPAPMAATMVLLSLAALIAAPSLRKALPEE